MKSKIRNTILVLVLLCSSIAEAESTKCYDSMITINVVCQRIETNKIIKEHPRTPVRIPNIYLNQSTGTLYFEDPCYETTLELVIPGTENVAYTYEIPDGNDTVLLPSTLSGEYELHIHRGNYCFFGMIELP